jgi:DedD protein
MPSREPELYKDKIEVSLDGRQIFYLFFGGAGIVGLVFVLGVMVGRRVEARGHLDRADTASASDPLAALDQLEGSDHLAFRAALTGSAAPTEVDKAISELERRRTAKPEPAVGATADAKPARPAPKADVKEVKVDARPETKPDAGPKADKRDADAGPKADKRDADAGPKADKRDADAGPKADKRDADRKPRRHDDAAGDRAAANAEPRHADARDRPVTHPDEARGATRPAARGEPSTEARTDTKPEARTDTKPEARTDTKPEARTDAKPEARTDAKPDDKDKKPGGKPNPEARTRFTLQLSSFQDKAEAEAFLATIKSAGYQPYVTEAEVGGKGTFYRVRLGTYRSLEAANDARAEFEKAARKTAQVMRL